jgi:hypothetical protein
MWYGWQIIVMVFVALVVIAMIMDRFMGPRSPG